jgi:hypothetical protein
VIISYGIPEGHVKNNQNIAEELKANVFKASLKKH